ncbi:MAG: AAA family ATPase [Clostridia bacterium]
MIAGKSAVGIVGKQPEWFWKPFIPAGRVTLIQGNTGIGKTSLMLRIVADSTNGLKPPTQFHGELLEQEKGEPITVFYITTENGIEDTLIPMFDLYGGKREHLYFQDEDEGHFSKCLE